MIKKVLAITGIRSEFDILYPIILELNNNPDIELKLVISGSHLSDWHGNFLEQLEEELAEAIERHQVWFWSISLQNQS